MAVDAITIAEAAEITSLSSAELAGHAALTVVGGMFSRAECEDLSLRLHQRDDPPATG